MNSRSKGVTKRRDGDLVATTTTETAPVLGVGLSSNIKGRHAELIAQMALLANGWSVLEPISPQPYDLAVRHPATRETFYVQVKTAYLRNEKRYGGDYIVVRGAKNTGKAYTLREVEYFIAVWQGQAYMFPNREKSEYWIKLSDVDVKWTKLALDL